MNSLKKKKNVNKKLVAGTAVLSIAAFISKVLSAVYRVPLENLVGNVGFYIYQQVYPIYGIGIAFGLTGLPAFVSRVIVDYDDPKQKRAVFFQLFAVMQVMGLVFFCLLLWFAPEIAALMGDTKLTEVIEAVSWMFLVIPWLAACRGYFQADLDMYPTAVSQVLEQIVRVSIIIAVAYIAASSGMNLYNMGFWAMLAAPIAAVISGVTLILYSWNLLVNFKWSDLHFSFYKRLKQVITAGGTLSVIASLMVLMQLVDSFTIKNGLVERGLSAANAEVQKGIFDRAQPVVQLGLVIGGAISTTALPQLAAYFHEKQRLKFKTLTQNAMRITLVITLAVTIGLISIMPELNQLLFGSRALSFTISVYCLSIIFATLILAYNSLFQSVDKLKGTFTAILVGMVIKIIIAKPFVIWFGISGASYSTVTALIVILASDWLIGRKIFNFSLFSLNFVSKMALISITMGIVVILAGLILSNYAGFTSRIDQIINLLIMVPLGVCVFGFLVLKFNLLEDSELKQIPILKHFRSK